MLFVICLDLSLPLLKSQLFLSVDTLMLAAFVGGNDGGGRTQIDPVRYIYIYSNISLSLSLSLSLSFSFVVGFGPICIFLFPMKVRMYRICCDDMTR